MKVRNPSSWSLTTVLHRNFTSKAKPTYWITSLYHKLLDNTVKDVPIIVAITTVSDKILHRLWAPAKNFRSGSLQIFL